MIQLLSVKEPNKLNFGLRQIYESSFPEDERRNWDQLLDLLGNTRYKLFEIYIQEKFIGFISVWDLEEINFIEHFAITDSEQGKGFGTQALNQVFSMNSKPFILEVEEPFTETAQKRISFYERLNFKVNEFSYFQPPYSIDKNSVKMLLMSYPMKIELENFERIKSQIHNQVYGYNG